MNGPNAEPEIATRIDQDGATVYLTREAVVELVEQLKRLADAEPEACCELHLGMHFSRWTGGQHKRPAVVFADEVPSRFEASRQLRFRQDVSRGDIDHDTMLEPFEITLMHVSREVVSTISSEGDNYDL